jgi:hypothetical protein
MNRFVFSLGLSAQEVDTERQCTPINRSWFNEETLDRTELMAHIGQVLVMVA